MQTVLKLLHKGSWLEHSAIVSTHISERKFSLNCIFLAKKIHRQWTWFEIQNSPISEAIFYFWWFIDFYFHPTEMLKSLCAIVKSETAFVFTHSPLIVCEFDSIMHKMYCAKVENV